MYVKSFCVAITRENKANSPLYFRRMKRDKDEGDDSIIRCVFASSDLIFNILRPLIDGDPCTTIGLLKLATVSKSFQNTVQSNQFWCDICYQRWKTKWGLRIRWNKALSDYNSLIELGNEESLINFWKSRYFHEERDARRRLITADELVSLVFDFRFWLGHQIINEDGDLITKSGLFESASRDFRFSVVPSDLDEYDGEGVGASHSQIPLHTIPASSARGQIKGHPMYETGIECKYDIIPFFCESSSVLYYRFTYMPRCFQKGFLRKMKVKFNGV